MAIYFYIGIFIKIFSYKLINFTLDNPSYISYYIFCTRHAEMQMREWLSGGVSPCQGEGRGFESRLALNMKRGPSFRWTSFHIPCLNRIRTLTNRALEEKGRRLSRRRSFSSRVFFTSVSDVKNTLRGRHGFAPSFRVQIEFVLSQTEPAALLSNFYEAKTLRGCRGFGHMLSTLTPTFSFFMLIFYERQRSKILAERTSRVHLFGHDNKKGAVSTTQYCSSQIMN